MLPAESEQPQDVNRKVKQVRAALRASDAFGELSDERAGHFQAVQRLCSQLRVFADAVVRQPRPAAPGVRDHAVARQVETDLDVVDAVFHRALASVKRLAVSARLRFNSQSLVSPEDAPVAGLRSRQLGAESAAHFSARKQAFAFVAVGVTGVGQAHVSAVFQPGNSRGIGRASAA